MRKFISFTDSELDTLANAVQQCGARDILTQIHDEIRIRKNNKKQYREWQKNKPKIYCC